MEGIATWDLEFSQMHCATVYNRFKCKNHLLFSVLGGFGSVPNDIPIYLSRHFKRQIKGEGELADKL